MLPATNDLETLSDEKVKSIVALANSQGSRNYTYAIVGMLCGTVSFLGCLGSYVYLVMQHHDVAAEVVLGATVLAIIGRMIRGR